MMSSGQAVFIYTARLFVLCSESDSCRKNVSALLKLNLSKLPQVIILSQVIRLFPNSLYYTHTTFNTFEYHLQQYALQESS